MTINNRKGTRGGRERRREVVKERKERGTMRAMGGENHKEMERGRRERKKVGLERVIGHVEGGGGGGGGGGEEEEGEEEENVVFHCN